MYLVRISPDTIVLIRQRLLAVETKLLQKLSCIIWKMLKSLQCMEWT